MTKRLLSIPAFMTAWLFAFSLLSNCYCMPTTFGQSAQETGMQSKMSAHCEHHSDAAKQKKSDCSPRVNSDQFELNQPQSHSALKVQTEAFVVPDIFSGSDFLSEEILKISHPQESPPPQFFLLHHSFRI